MAGRRINPTQHPQHLRQPRVSRRGGEGNQEVDAMLSQVRRFLEAHGEARFVDWDRPSTKDTHAPRVMNRCGYRRYDDGTGPHAGPHWYVFPEVFKAEVCKGHDAGAVARLLLNLGHIERGTEKDRPYTSRHDLPGDGRRRVYHVLPSIIGEAGDTD
jgi:putative DNA primase/helicase